MGACPTTDNLRETILPASRVLCLAFFLSVLIGRVEIPAWESRGFRNGTVSNRDLLSKGSVLSEVSPALASRILDGTGNTGSTA
jgi:hypothetical protein